MDNWPRWNQQEPWYWLTFTLQFREVVRPCLVWKTRDIVRSFQSVAEFLAANQNLRSSARVVTAKNKIRIGFGFYIRTSWNWEEIRLFYFSTHTLITEHLVSSTESLNMTNHLLSWKKPSIFKNCIQNAQDVSLWNKKMCTNSSVNYTYHVTVLHILKWCNYN